MSDNSHYSIVKDLLQLFHLQASQKRPKFNIHFNQLIGLFECSTSGGQLNQPIWRVRLSCISRFKGCSLLTLEIVCSSSPTRSHEAIGGGEGVRTPDLRLAKPALCQTELRPLSKLKGWLRGRDLNPRPLGYEPNELPDCSTPRQFQKTWWAWVESNYRPHAYQACALTN